MYKTLKLLLTHTDTPEHFWLEYDIFDNKLSQDWAYELHHDCLNNPDIVMDKNFCLHAWGKMAPRNLEWLCKELNFHIEKVNLYLKENNIDYYVDMVFDPATVDQEQLNKIHRHFEVLHGFHHGFREQLKGGPPSIFFSINQFNHFCHEMEGILWSRNSSNDDRQGSMIICLYPNDKKEIKEEHLKEFKMKNYIAGDIRMHFPQTGKQFIEAFHSQDENVPMDDIQPIKYYNGEFDLVFHDVDVDWDGFREWLKEKGIDENDKRNALGYATLGRWRIPEGKDDFYRRYVKMFNNIQTIQLLDEEDKLMVSHEFDPTWSQQYYWQINEYYKK